MQAIKRKPGVPPMIEPSLIEWPQLGIRTVVLDVARYAVPCDVPVNAFLLRDPLRHTARIGRSFGRSPIRPLNSPSGWDK